MGIAQAVTFVLVLLALGVGGGWAESITITPKPQRAVMHVTGSQFFTLFRFSEQTADVDRKATAAVVPSSLVLFHNNNNEHSPGHVNCPACDEGKHVEMAVGRAGESTFSEAAWKWLEGRRGHIAASTAKDYEDYIRTIERYFRLPDGSDARPLRLRDVHIGHIVAYQRSRQAHIRVSAQHKGTNAKRGANKPLPSDGGSRINHETCVLRQVLDAAGLWKGTDVARLFRPIPLPKEGPGIALTADEEKHLFDVASSRPRWLVAYYCSLLSRNTTAGPGEILHLRLRSIHTSPSPMIMIEEGTKNDFRVRPIPLNSDARKAIAWLLSNAASKGSYLPEHYLLPHRADVAGGDPDPTRPMGSYKKAWGKLRAEAGKKYPRLLTLRRYDLRHTACTAMLENPAIPEATIEAIMGHRLGSRTKLRYRHLRDQTLRAATDAIASSARTVVEPPPPKSPSARADVCTKPPLVVAAARGRVLAFPGREPDPAA